MREQHRGPLAEAPVTVTETWRQWLGETVDKEFPLREYLGGSAHAAVFLSDCGREEPQPAAIKLIAETSNADRQVESWRLARSLSHPHLLRIFRFGRTEIAGTKLLYVVMELADEDLSQILPVRALTEGEATEMLEPVVDALTYLHENGLLHGGIKPSNILARRDQLKLSTDGLRRTGGTIIDPGSYDPPEAAFSAAGDVWSLGITLVEVLTRGLPAWDRNAATDPDLPESLPAPLLEIARHCLRRDARRRWTIPDIANCLNPASAAPPAASRPGPPVQQSARPVQPNASPSRSSYLILSVILLLVLTGLAGLKLLTHSSQPGAVPSQGAKVAEKNTSENPRDFENAAAPESARDQATQADEPTEKPTAEQGSGREQTPPSPPPAPSPQSSLAVVHQVMPDVPQKARNTIRGTVRVGIRVSVDPLGSVTNAVVDSPGPSQYFANLALEAARQWKFAPAGNASSDWIIHFEFLADGTNASVRPAS